MKYLTRICHNENNWEKPSGTTGKKEIQSSYSSQFGFGHEEWLFRSEWVIDGWRYAFVQGVNKSRKRLLKEAEPFELILFTVDADQQRRYVGGIDEVECLNDQQAADVLALFQENGWYDTMRAEIAEYGLNPDHLGHEEYAPVVFNIRFRLDNVKLFAPDNYAKPTDPIIERCKRYQLYSVITADERNPDAKRKPKGKDFVVIPQFKPSTRTVTYQRTPEHAQMQDALFEQLKREHPTPNEKVLVENEFVDITVETEDEFKLYEIKSDQSPRTVLRLAIGQLLEYAYYAKERKKRLTLIAVGRKPLDKDAEQYLALLKEHFGLPLQYRCVSLA